MRADSLSDRISVQAAHTRASSRKGTEKTIREHSEAETLGESTATPRYFGSYGKLKGFITTCLREDVITDKYFDELNEALEDISDHGKEKDRKRHITVHLRNMINLEEGGEEEAMGLVMDGLSLMEMETSEIMVQKPAALNEAAFKAKGKAESANLLGDMHFDCRMQGNMRENVQTVTYGYSSPYNLVGKYKINLPTLHNWVGAIAKAYTSSAYHNWRHALDVFQFIHVSVAVGDAGEYFYFQDLLALFTGAIAHDVGHTGVNNAFLVNTGAKLAITYNDRSPLENMHASVCFETLAQPGNNFLDVLKAHEHKGVRLKIIENILATDMSHHFELTDKFGARVQMREEQPFSRGRKTERDGSSTHELGGVSEKVIGTKEDRRLLMQAFTHMADLGHSCRPWDIHKEMCLALEEEFFLQGDRERKAGLAVSPMMDRSKDSMASGQGFFLDKLVRPILEPCCTFLSMELADFWEENLDTNMKNWSLLVTAKGKLSIKELLPHEAEVFKAAAEGEDLSMVATPSRRSSPTMEKVNSGGKNRRVRLRD